jgi:cytochrome c5
MSENKRDAGHEGLIKTPKQLIIVVALAFLVPILLITLISQYVTSIRRIDLSSPALSAKAVAERLKPVAEVTMAGASGSAAATAAPAPVAKMPATAPAAEKTAAAPAAEKTAAAPAAEKTAAAPAAGNAEGKKIFETTCVVCHGTGVAGAPKAGDKAAWAPRLKQGMPALYKAAIHGLNAMPARGGNPAYTDAQIKAAVNYLTSLAR